MGASADWWYACEENLAISQVSVVGFSPPSSLCCLNLNTLEGFDELEINKVPAGRFCPGQVKRLAAGHGMKHRIKPKGQVSRKKHRTHFSEATSVFCAEQK